MLGFLKGLFGGAPKPEAAAASLRRLGNVPVVVQGQVSALAVAGGRLFVASNDFVLSRTGPAPTNLFLAAYDDRGERVAQWPLGDIWSLAVSGSTLLIARKKGIEARDFDGKELWSAPIGEASLASAGDFVFAGSNGEIARLDASSGRVLARARYGTGTIALAVTSDGRVASGMRDGSVIRWSPELAQLDAFAAADPDDSITNIRSLAFSPDGNRLAVGAWERPVKIYDEAGQATTCGEIKHAMIHALAWRDAETLVGAFGFPGMGSIISEDSLTGAVAWWSASGELRGRLDVGEQLRALVADGDRLFAGGARGGVRRLGAAQNGDAGKPYAVSLSADGKRAAITVGTTVQLVDLDSGDTVRTIEQRYLHRHVWSADLSRFARPENSDMAVFDSDNPSAPLWTASLGRYTSDVRLSADGRRVVLWKDSELACFEEGRELWRSKVDFINGVIFRGTEVVVWSGSRLRVLSADGSVVLDWQAHAGKFPWFESGELSPDGQLLLVGCVPDGAQLLDIGARKIRWARDKKLGARVAWSRNGKHFVAARYDGSLVVHDIDGREVAQAKAVHRFGASSHLGFPRADRVVSFGADGGFVVWALT
jgi:WD40 repeat protein